MLRESDRNRPIRDSLRYTKWSSFWSAIQEDTGRKQSKIKGKSEFGKHAISTNDETESIRALFFIANDEGHGAGPMSKTAGYFP